MTREEAIKIIKEFQGTHILSTNLSKSLKTAIEALKKEPKTGHWVEKEDTFGDTYYDCSICGESWSIIDGEPWNNGMKYCPNCGAKMESEG